MRVSTGKEPPSFAPRAAGEATQEQPRSEAPLDPLESDPRERALEAARRLRGTKDRRTFSIAHLNDLHAQFLPSAGADGKQTGGIARHAALIKQLRAEDEHAMVLCAGDLFDATLLHRFFKGDLGVRILNTLGCAGMALGNSEPGAGLDRMTEALKKADFDVLCANLDASVEPGVREVINNRYTVREINGFKIGIFGLSTPDTVDPMHPEQPLAHQDIAGAAQAVIDHMTKAEGIDIVLCLSHCGSDVDRKLAGELRGVDVILGGHSHDRLVEHHTDKDGNPVLVAQAGCFGQTLGVMNLAFDDQGHLDTKLCSVEIVPIDELLPEDPEIRAMVEEFEAPLRAILDATVLPNAPAIDGDWRQVRSREHPLSNLLADATLENARGRGAEIALVNASHVRVGLPDGRWRVRDVAEAFPYDTPTGVVSLTGAQIQKTLEASVATIGFGKEETMNGGLLTGADLRYTFDVDPKKGPAVGSIEVRVDGRWTAIDPDRSYRVAMPRYALFGGCGLPTGQWSRAPEAKLEWIETPARDMVIDFVKEHGPPGPIDGRLAGGPAHRAWTRAADFKHPPAGAVHEVRGAVNDDGSKPLRARRPPRM